MKILTALSSLLLLSVCSHAMNIEVKGGDTIEIKFNHRLKSIRLDIMVNGYSVKCDGSKILVWGKPKKMNEGNPQDTNIILLDISNNYKKYEQGLSEGVFGVEYLKAGSNAYIDSNQGVFINLFNGYLKEVTSEFDPSDEHNFESCKKHESWEFNRYP